MSYNNNKVEFLANKIKNSDDEFLSYYSKDGCYYRSYKDDIMKSVNNCIKSEINTFKKVHGTKFITLSSNKFHEQKSDPEVVRLMMPKLKKQVEDNIENCVIEKMKSDLEEYGSEMCDKKLEDLIKHNIEEALKDQLKNVNDLFH